MKPRNHAGKMPLRTMSGTWVSMNHFDASSLSLPSVPSVTDSSGCSLCSILVWPWSQPEETTVIYSNVVTSYFNNLICLFSRRRQRVNEPCSMLSLFKFIAGAAERPTNVRITHPLVYFILCFTSISNNPVLLRHQPWASLLLKLLWELLFSLHKLVISSVKTGQNLPWSKTSNKPWASRLPLDASDSLDLVLKCCSSFQIWSFAV